MVTTSQSSAINFAIANENGKMALEINGADTNEALANLVCMLKESIDLLGIDTEVFNY